jgi:hypothetical protein
MNILQDLPEFSAAGNERASLELREEQCGWAKKDYFPEGSSWCCYQPFTVDPEIP